MAAGLGRFDAALPELRANWRCLWDLVTRRGMNFLLTFLVSVMVFSGGAQFILASLLMLDAPISSIFMTLFFLNCAMHCWDPVFPSICKMSRNVSSGCFPFQ